MIDTIIFDWGGVLTVGRYTLSLLDVLSKEHDLVLHERYEEFDSLIVAMNESKMSVEAFIDEVNARFNGSFDITMMKDIFSKAIKPNHEVISFTKDLAQKYNLILLSNNDDLTVEVLRQEHQEMLSLFSHTYFSNEMDSRKPEKKMFLDAIADAKITPEKCVFIDDKQKNVDAGNSCGLKGIKFENIKQLKEEFATLGITLP